MIFVIWLGVAFAIVFWKAARASSRGTRARAYFAYGCLAFLIPNAMTFTIGHQIFGDPLVLTVTGIVAGFLLSLPYANPRRVVGRIRVSDRGIRESTRDSWRGEYV